MLRIRVHAGEGESFQTFCCLAALNPEIKGRPGWTWTVSPVLRAEVQKRFVPVVIESVDFTLWHCSVLWHEP